MSASPPPRTKAYLLQNRLNSFHTVGELELTDTHVRCWLQGSAGWIAEELGMADLDARLQAGEAVSAFDFRRDELDVKWLRQFMGGGFQIGAGDSRRWLVSLIYPSTAWSMVEALDGRSAHRQWRKALGG